MPQTAKTQTK